jgi:DNA-binding Lrp family transcriptional regulator
MNHHENLDFHDDPCYTRFRDPKTVVAGEGAMKRQVITVTRELDDTDHQIIAALKEDGRTSFAQIAQQLDVSPGMVRQRYLQLVADGILQVAAITNPTRMGYDMMALIGVRADGNRLREIARGHLPRQYSPAAVSHRSLERRRRRPKHRDLYLSGNRQGDLSLAFDCNHKLTTKGERI